MHAYCVTGSSKDTRVDFILKKMSEEGIIPFDQVVLEKDNDEEHIGIGAVRIFTNRLLLSPQKSPYVAGIIYDAHVLTIEAQNALLKLIEEPPPRVHIYIETPQRDQLLPTIISRCAHIQLTGDVHSDQLDDVKKDLTNLLSAKPGDVLKMVEAFSADRQTAKIWTTHAIAAARELLLARIQNDDEKQSATEYTNLLRKLLTAQKELAVNVNPKLVLDAVFLVH